MRAAVSESKNVKTSEAENLSLMNFVGAIGGLTGGFVLMLFGALLSAISLFTQINFHGWGVILILAAFVFLAIGSHFLDLIDGVKRLKRKQKLNL